MNILSLFDGISCGRVALERAGIKVNTYYASEIDEYAIQVTQKNYPDTVQLGDVNNIDFNEYIGKVDLLIGGSPCKFWSIAKQNREVDKSGEGWKLFSRYLDALRIIKPKYFLYENVASMPNTIKNFISEEFGYNPIFINSALVSAQMRKRLYWTNIPNVDQPKDKKIYLKDIVEGEGVKVDREKSLAIISSIGRTTPREYFKKNQGQMVFVDKDKAYCIDASYYKGANWQQYISKSRRQLVIEMVDGDLLVRKLTPLECERLQTLPDNYTDGISNTQRYKCIGNGWTVNVIAHILKNIAIKQ